MLIFILEFLIGGLQNTQLRSPAVKMNEEKKLSTASQVAQAVQEEPTSPSISAPIVELFISHSCT